MATYDSLSAEEYRTQLERQGADEDDIRAALAELESRR